ncbi:uncharacterized protein LOC125452490 isoform X2 [Stegostoma tigrinum]|uniref:uncharacterized protein LOC125452490 isoform X2 n=1 Tax=Stegostoma tigrinum TaxID=3053191 RepID=UPI00202B7074|nr:uncharacterized protein LOC125452490 isoform X2 [Stegostoma tigrinum]
MLGRIRSCFSSVGLFATCRRGDPDASRTFRYSCSTSPPPLSPSTGRTWSCWPPLPATYSGCSLDLASGNECCVIHVPELECERSTCLQLAACIPCSAPAEKRDVQCSGKFALSRCFMKLDWPDKFKCSKTTHCLEKSLVFYLLNFVRHYSVLLLRPIFKVCEPDTRYFAIQPLCSLFFRAMEAVSSNTEEDNTMMLIDCDQQSNEEHQAELTLEPATCVGDSPANSGWLLSDSNDKGCLQNDVLEGTEKTEETKEKRLKAKKRKRNQSAAKNEIKGLLAELPFAKAEIREECGFTALPEKTSKKKRKRTLGGENEDDAGQKKKKKVHPNYFVSIPITNPKIIDGVKAVQQIVVQADERLSKAMIPVACLHVTILVMHLANEVEVNKAVNVVEECKETMQEILQGKQLALQFQGIADFRGEVVFAQLVQNEHLTTLAVIAETVKTRFQANGILTADSKAFKPHLTFMKLSRAPKLRHQGIKKFSPELYKNFEDRYLGDEIVTCLHLCSMLKKKQPNGYYHCETSVPVGKKCDTDVIKNALQKETITVRCKLNQIKELLSHPGIQIRIQREMAVSSTAKKQ